jgi:endonuclease YncB( thermonuclease family)
VERFCRNYYRGSAFFTMALIMFLLAWLIAPCLSEDTAAPEGMKTEREEVRVHEVVAGDTLILEDERIIRLAGVDAFEPYDLGWVDNLNPDRADLADRAKELCKQYILDQPVYLEFPSEFSDVLDRKWAYVYLPDDRCLNELLLAEGLVQILPGMPSHPKSKVFNRVQKQALETKSGVWELDLNEITVRTGDDPSEGSDQEVEQVKKVDYSPPGTHRKTESSSGTSRSNAKGFVLIFVIIGLVGGGIYAVMILNAEKPCPMCHRKNPKRADECSNCGYNYKTGYLGDSELQTWVTQNIKVKKSAGKKKSKKRKS